MACALLGNSNRQLHAATDGTVVGEGGRALVHAFGQEAIGLLGSLQTEHPAALRPIHHEMASTSPARIAVKVASDSAKRACASFSSARNCRSLKFFAEGMGA